jgi:hypothetical protein
MAGIFGGGEGEAAMPAIDMAALTFDPSASVEGIQAIQAGLLAMSTQLTAIYSTTLPTLQATFVAAAAVMVQNLATLLTTGIMPVNMALLNITGVTLPGLLSAWLDAANQMVSSLQPVLAMIMQINNQLMAMIRIAQQVGEAVKSAMQTAAEGFEAASEKLATLIEFIQEATTNFRKMADAAAAAASASQSAGSTAPGGGFAHGTFATGTQGIKVVPPGFNQDNYMIGMTSGEEFAVAPRGESLAELMGAGSRGGKTVNNNYYVNVTSLQPSRSITQDLQTLQALSSNAG